MKPGAVFILILTVISGCGKPEVPKIEQIGITPEIQLERSIEEHGEVIFYGWNGMQHNEGGNSWLSFCKDRTVRLNIMGYNIDLVSGSYSFVDDRLIKISFDGINAPESSKPGYTANWPLLRLSREGGDLLVHRADGKTAWHIDWPLYPSITENVWPARAGINRTGKDSREKPPARSGE